MSAGMNEWAEGWVHICLGNTMGFCGEDKRGEPGPRTQGAHTHAHQRQHFLSDGSRCP